ncbi:type II toxin-antitoxin system RelE/ParE family toxin [Methylopila sp. Yamaguchi]|uniref:type II toxin-antitoxin system RelE/ParE family toxin n=1 Tax=Methylopila sp. Yamaguchi TaxID=1437817 RepID=UPI000CB3094B|nr:type II toxin-antitoxin system RelE/ParE family toxin [Methylopila sp. Yamaguchi]GBD47502.1 RelE/StbE family addiction module toxin [Methylopila sp. Yamaguchi]
MIVRYTARARDHLRAIGDHIGQDDPIAAGRVLDRIGQAVSRLEAFPLSGRRGRRRGSYELLVPRLPYIVVYRMREDYVDILGVFHAARHPSTRTKP